MDETRFSYELLVDTSMVDGHRQLSYAGLLRLIQTAVEEHLLNIGMDVPSIIAKYGYSWVSLSIHAELPSPPKPGERLYVRSWYSGRSGVVFRREMQMHHADGSAAVNIALHFALMDLRNRKLVTDEQLLRQFVMPAGVPLLRAESRLSETYEDWQDGGTRYIYPSWLDGLQHVNNTRYGEMIQDTLYDRLPDGQLRRLELYFQSELHQGETVLLRCRDGGDHWLVQGIHEGSGSLSFQARVFR